MWRDDAFQIDIHRTWMTWQTLWKIKKETWILEHKKTCPKRQWRSQFWEVLKNSARLEVRGSHLSIDIVHGSQVFKAIQDPEKHNEKHRRLLNNLGHE